jgi:hypothetical protein
MLNLSISVDDPGRVKTVCHSNWRGATSADYRGRSAGLLNGFSARCGSIRFLRSSMRVSVHLLARLSQLVAETGYSTGKNASPIKGREPKTWRSEDQVA